MSLTNFELTKSWENPSDFPTYEEEEAQVLLRDPADLRK